MKISDWGQSRARLARFFVPRFVWREPVSSNYNQCMVENKVPSLLEALRNALALVKNTSELPENNAHRRDLERSLLLKERSKTSAPIQAAS